MSKNWLCYTWISENFESAINYVETHRNVKPPTYNSKRVKELPQPMLGIHSNTRANDSSNDSSSDDVNSSNESDIDNEAENVDVLNASENPANSVANANGNDSLEADTHSSSIASTSETNRSTLNDSRAENSPIQSDTIAATDGEDDTDLSNDFQNGNAQIEKVFNSDPIGNTSADSTNGDEVDPLALHSVPGACASSITSKFDQTGISNQSDDESLLVQSTFESASDGAVDPLMNFADTRIKIETVPLYELHTDNSDEMDALFDEPDEIHFDDSDDDLIMIMPTNVALKPLGVTEDELVKRENDVLTKNVPFNDGKIKVSVLNFQ